MKKAQSLTASSLDGLTSGRRVDLSMPGLSVSVNRSGKKVWTFRRRIAGVKTIVSMTLGTYPAHTIAAARQWAASLNLLIERGEDPRGALGPAKMPDVVTVADAHQIYMTAVRRGDRKILKPRTLLDKEVIFKRDISPRLGNAPLATLSEDECWDAVYDKAGSSKVRFLTGWVETFERLPEGAVHRGVPERPDYPWTVPHAAAKVLGTVLATVVMSERVDEGVIQTLHDMALRAIRTLHPDQGEVSGMRAYLIRALLNGGQRDPGQQYLANLASLLNQNDDMLDADIPDYVEALAARIE